MDDVFQGTNLSSLPARGAWIEIHDRNSCISKCWSLPARGAWIEMCYLWYNCTLATVAPRTGSVD